jgi:hypothetical protein
VISQSQRWLLCSPPHRHQPDSVCKTGNAKLCTPLSLPVLLLLLREPRGRAASLSVIVPHWVESTVGADRDRQPTTPCSPCSPCSLLHRQPPPPSRITVLTLTAVGPSPTPAPTLSGPWPGSVGTPTTDHVNAVNSNCNACPPSILLSPSVLPAAAFQFANSRQWGVSAERWPSQRLQHCKFVIKRPSPACLGEHEACKPAATTPKYRFLRRHGTLLQEERS